MTADTAKKDNLRNSITVYMEMYNYFKNHLSDAAGIPPSYVYIEPINTCNLDCPFCATSAVERPVKAIDFKVYKNILDGIARAGWSGFTRLGLNGQGEGLLNKRLVDMVAYAKDSGFAKVELITNGTLLDKSISKKLIDNGLDGLQFSIDSVRKRTYDTLRKPRVKGKSYFYDVMQNIMDFLMLNIKSGRKTYVSISAVLTSINKEERESFINFWKTLPVDNIFFPQMSTLQDYCPSSEAIRYKGPISEKQVCMMPWTGMSIKSNGDVVACSHDFDARYTIGNAGESEIRSLWNGPKIKKLRRALISGELDYFAGIGHDCIKCNNPCIGLGRRDFIASMPIYVEKMLLRDCHDNERVDLSGKIERLKALRKKFSAERATIAGHK